LPTRSCVLSVRPSPPGVHRWVCGISKQHRTRIEREGEEERRARAMPFASLAGSVYCYRDEAHRKETSGRSHKKDHERSTDESRGITPDDRRMQRVQYIFY